MLDQFGAVDAGDQKLRLKLLRTLSFVHRAPGQLLRQNRPVDFAKLRFRTFVAYTDHHPVGMEEIEHGRAFAQEFWIGRDREAPLRITAVDSECTRELLPGLHRHSALLDYQLRTARLRCNQASSAVNGAEVRVAILQRRRTDANEDDIAETHRLGKIGGKSESPRCDIVYDEILQMGLVDGQTTSAEGFDLVLIIVGAKNRVADFGQTCSRHQTDIAAT